MNDRDPTPVVPPPETTSSAFQGLNVSGNSSGGTPVSPETFRGLGLIGDLIGVVCLFFLLFAGLFAGSLLQ